MLLGVDAGGTSTRAVLVDPAGRCVGYGTAGGGNPVSWGPEQAATAIATAVRVALARAGDGVAVTGTAVLAMAGGSAFSVTDALASPLRALGLPAGIVLASDLLATFCSGTPELAGYGLVAGTGAAAIRVAGGAVDASADGLGWLLGDGGSGFWIGHRVARAALADLDRRGPATALTPLVLDELGITPTGRRDLSGRPAELQAAVDALYRWRPVELSRLAAAAFRAAGLAGPAGDGDPAGGDPVATAILAAARDRLVRLLDALRTGDVPGPVVVGGGIARRLPGLAEAIGESFDGAARPVVIAVADGAVGAGVLALRHAGHVVDRAVFATLTETLADLTDAR